MSGASLTALCGARIFTGHAMLVRHAVLFGHGTIVDVMAEAKVPGDAQRIELGDRIVAPGFIDLQVNGGGDVLFGAEPTVSTLTRIGAAHARFGTTRFLPTVITGPRAIMHAARAAVAAALGDGRSGVLGVHFEGPFLNPDKRGVHDAVHIRTPDDADRDSPGGDPAETN